MTARYNAEIEEKNWRIYLADSVYLHAYGEMFKERYSELIDTQRQKDDRNGNEVAKDIMTKFGLTFKQGG